MRAKALEEGEERFESGLHPEVARNVSPKEAALVEGADGPALVF